MRYLYVPGDDLSLCPRDVCLCVGPRLQPEGNQPTYEDDPGLEETLLGAVQCFTAVLLPANHAVVGLGTHWRHVYREEEHLYLSGEDCNNIIEFPDLQYLVVLVTCTDPVWGCRGWFPWQSWERCAEGKTS